MLVIHEGILADPGDVFQGYRGQAGAAVERAHGVEADRAGAFATDGGQSGAIAKHIVPVVLADRHIAGAVEYHLGQALHVPESMTADLQRPVVVEGDLRDTVFIPKGAVRHPNHSELIVVVRRRTNDDLRGALIEQSGDGCNHCAVIIFVQIIPERIVMIALIGNSGIAQRVQVFACAFHLELEHVEVDCEIAAIRNSALYDLCAVAGHVYDHQTIGGRD